MLVSYTPIFAANIFRIFRVAAEHPWIIPVGIIGGFLIYYFTREKDTDKKD